MSNFSQEWEDHLDAIAEPPGDYPREFPGPLGEFQEGYLRGCLFEILRDPAGQLPGFYWYCCCSRCNETRGALCGPFETYSQAVNDYRSH